MGCKLCRPRATYVYVGCITSRRVLRKQRLADVLALGNTRRDREKS
jgi:hypothetical protein